MSANRPQLPDNQFIQDDKKKPSLPFWVLGIFFSLVTLVTGYIGSELSLKLQNEVEDNPFLNVTNREFSIFLWQFPEHMRVNTSRPKAGYLTGFQYKDKLNIERGKAEDYVVAPPEILFLYHTWKRLLSDEFIANKVSTNDFINFLNYSDEWQPQNWKKAPKEFVNLINEINNHKFDQYIPIDKLPKDVLQAFQGWKNFFIDGYAINKIEPSYEEMEKFLNISPHYARNYWINIVRDQYPQYLKTLFSGDYLRGSKIPQNELSPFLKVAFYNYIHQSSSVDVDDFDNFLKGSIRLEDGLESCRIAVGDSALDL